jgi:hypothetical protein
MKIWIGPPQNQFGFNLTMIISFRFNFSKAQHFFNDSAFSSPTATIVLLALESAVF